MGREKKSITYKGSGVDIDAQDEALAGIKKLATATFNRSTLSDIGSFGGLFALSPDDPGGDILVASADGVGTKLKVAQMADRYDTVGADLVNHCVNDILVQGATPLFFMDYFAAGRLVPEKLVEVVRGLSRACRDNGCVLLGGETAEMPGLYYGEDFDLAGFIVGLVKRSRLLPRNIRVGDRLLGLPSSGLHTNGYSLARRLFFEEKGFSVKDRVEELGTTVGELLLAVHRSCLRPLRPLLQPGSGLKGLAHITGGGIPDNLPRILPEGVQAVIRPDGWRCLPIFDYIAREGNVPEEDMRRTFNMGVAMILCVEADREDEITKRLKAAGEECFPVGELVEGPRGVAYKDGSG